MRGKREKRRGTRKRMLALFLALAMIMTLNTTALTWAAAPGDADVATVDETPSPEATALPETTPSPEVTALPEDEPVPTETQQEDEELQGEETPAPEVAPSPEVTAAPEETPAPQPTEEPAKEAEEPQMQTFGAASPDTAEAVTEEAPVASIGDVEYASLAAAVEAAKSGDTITVLADTTLIKQLVIPAEKDLTLDLNGRTIQGKLDDTLIYVKGTLLVKDKTAGELTVSEDYQVAYTSGKLSNETAKAIKVIEGGTLRVESGQICSGKNTAVAVCGEEDSGEWETPVDSLARIVGGYLQGREGGVGVYGHGATVTVEGGVVEATDNAAVAGNGSKNETINDGGTTINISGGTLISHISSKGYIACGIYHPQKGEVNIKGGTIYADGGVGVLMRGGTLTMSGGQILATGTVTGYVGDAENNCGSHGIAVDRLAKYSDYENIKVSISGGIVRSDLPEGALHLFAEGEIPSGIISATGGLFSNKIAAEYCAEGYRPTKMADADGYYTVDNKVHTITVKVDGAGTAKADVKDGIKGDTVKLTATPTAGEDSKFKEWKVTAGAGTFADKASAVTAFTIGDTTEDIVLTAVFVGNDHKVTVTDDGNGTGSTSPATAKKGEKVKLTATPKEGSDYEFDKWVVESGGVTVTDNTFTMDTKDVTVKATFKPIMHKVTVTAEGDGTAKADPITAKKGDTVKLTATPKPGSDSKFKEWKVTKGGVTVKDDTFVMGTADVEVTAVFTGNDHKITVTDDGNGTGSASPATAKKGEKVTLTATPKDSDYKLKSWQVTEGNVSVAADGTFVMGDKDVKVTAVFEKKEGLKQEVDEEGDKFFVYDDGSHKTGWFDAGNDWNFYLDPEKDGAAATGFKEIGEDAYLFDDNGLQIKIDGTPVVDGKKYWTTAEGTLGSGKMVLGNMMLYFDEDTYEAQTGITQIEDKHYLFNDDGVLIVQAGTPIDAEKKYWFKEDGSLGSGWMNLAGMKLYFDEENFEAAIGPKVVEEKPCLFNKDGVLQEKPGTPEVNGKKYWVNKDGELGTDWMTLTTWKMHFDPVTYAAATGLQEIDGEKYLFDKNGVCYLRSRTDVIDGKKYWFNEGGSLGTGWKNLAGMELYFDPDTCEGAVGTVTIEGKEYTFDNNGVLQK